MRSTPSRRLLAYLARHRRAYASGFACAVATTAIALSGPWVLKHAIDGLAAEVTMAKVRLYAAALLALATAGGVFRFLMRRIVVGASRDFEYELRNDFFAHLQRLDAAYYERNRTGDLMSRATSDLNAVRMLIGPAVMYGATTGLTFVVGIALMLTIDARLTIIALVPLPLLSLAVWYFGAVIHRQFDTIQAQLSDVSSITQESLAGVRVIRAYRQEPHEVSRFRRANEEYVRRNRALIRVQGVYYPTMGLLMGIGSLLVLWLGSRSVIAGRMSVGELVAFNTYLMMLAWPMIAFGWVTNLVQRGTASWKRMLDVMDAEAEVADPPPAPETSGGAPVSPAIRGEIEFRHLTFAYGERPVLRDISATIPAGTTTAVVGPTGAGKSTLLALLARLREPPPGTVFVDGIDVGRMPLGVLRCAIGFVPQEVFLFSASVADNIALGAAEDQASRERIEAAAAIARLDKDIGRLPNGYDTIVGERGITLSGGQKQRTAIARALVVDPRILVLDDALSAVDTHTEEELLGRLSTVMRERTCLIVSHRISTVRHADQILVLDDGRIVERGTHDALVARNGVYAELHRRQLLQAELEEA